MYMKILNRFYFGSFIALIALVSANVTVGAVDIEESQQGKDIEWLQNDDRFYMVQRTAHSRLLLTPNEAFFPKGKLLAQGEGEVPDVDRLLNGGKSYDNISKWNTGDQVEWGVWLDKAGEIEVQIWMANTGSRGRYTLSFGDQTETFSTKNRGSSPDDIAAFSFSAKKPGQYSLLLTCKDESKSSKAQLHAIEITGSAVKGAAVLRKRWRPAAAHARFSSSRGPNDVHLCIMEMDAKPGTLGFYAPITTPFGYYGPSWKASGLVSPSFNFSLWSFGAGKEAPPVEKLSHLVAIGNPDAEFGGFSHEGTGVKIRDWNPLEGREGQRQTFAIRLEPGEKYTTYFTYFYAEDEQRWRLFGVGKTYNKRKPLQTLSIGSFVEVPGPPHVQRTGPYERQMRYRGWAVDNKGNLHPFDRMSTGNVDKKTGLTHTDRGVTEEGWFYLQTGGWSFREKWDEKTIKLPRNVSHEVTYLDPDDLEYLQTVPSAIAATGVKKSSTGAVLSFDIENPGKEPKVKIYWGTEEGLTFAGRWENSMRVKNLREGSNKVTLKDVSRGKPLFVRLFLKNEEGQFWSMETFKSSD
jgi:hypothetical protein